MKHICRIAFAIIIAAAFAGANFIAQADDRTDITVENVCEAVPVTNGIKLSATDKTTFEIYSITGQKVKSASIEDGSFQIELPKGCYIVRCPQWSKKVVVK